MKRIVIIVTILIIILEIISLSLDNKLSDTNLSTKNIEIIADKNEFEKIYKEIYETKNEEVKKSFENIKTKADKVLEEPLCQYEIDEGNRMLDVSRQCKERIETLGFIIKIQEVGKRKKTSRYRR